MTDLEQELTITLQRYELGLIIVALDNAIDEAENRRNVALMQLLLELSRKIQAQFRTE